MTNERWLLKKTEEYTGNGVWVVKFIPNPEGGGLIDPESEPPIETMGINDEVKEYISEFRKSTENRGNDFSGSNDSSECFDQHAYFGQEDLMGRPTSLMLGTDFKYEDVQVDGIWHSRHRVYRYNLYPNGVGTHQVLEEVMRRGFPPFWETTVLKERYMMVGDLTVLRDIKDFLQEP